VRAASGGPPVVKRIAVLLCRFSDTTDYTPHPKSWYEGLVGSVFPGVSHYWQEASYGLFNFDGSVVYGWYNLPRPRSYYLNPPGGFYGYDYGKLLADATAVADADVNFPAFPEISICVNDKLATPAGLANAGVTPVPTELYREVKRQRQKVETVWGSAGVGALRDRWLRHTACGPATCDT
jgi:hypothetical protein